MKSALLSVTAAALWLSMGSVKAATYSGEYGWLSFYHTTWSNSPAYSVNGTPGMYFMGQNYGDNTHDVYRQVSWAQAVTINSARVSTFAQLGTGGSIGAWSIQYSADGISGWTNVPVTPATQALMTGDTGGGFGYVDAPLTSSVTAKALRVFFAAGSYAVGSSGVISGPGVSYIQTRGTLTGGFDMNDPEFDIIATSGVLPSTPTVAFAGYTNSGEFSGGNLVDQYIGYNGPRAGFYPAVASGATMTFDLQTKLAIGTVRLYAGSYYQYLPTSASLQVSNDGVNFVPILGGTLTATGPGIIEYVGTGAYSGQYLRFTNWVLPSTDYVLPNEMFLSIPEPASLSLLALGGLALLRRRRK